MRKPNWIAIKEHLFNFLLEATQNQSQLKYVLFNYVHGAIFGAVLWNYVIYELCFGVDPFWILYFVVVAFGKHWTNNLVEELIKNLIKKIVFEVLEVACS